MDGCAGRRPVDRKRSGLGLRENMNKKDGKNVPFCSRMGCSAKATSTKETRISSTDKSKKVCRPPAWSSSNGKDVVGSSSRTPGRFGFLRKTAKDTAWRPPSSNLDTYSLETSSNNDDLSVAEPIPQRQKTKRDTMHVRCQSSVSRKVAMSKAGSTSKGISRSSHEKSDLGTRGALTGLSVSSSSGNSDHTVTGGLSRNRLRNLRCNSVSGVLLADSSSATKINVTKKKTPDGESRSSSKGNKTNFLVTKGSNQNSSHGNGIKVCDDRRNRLVPTIRENSVVSSRRSLNFGRSERLGAVASSPTSLQMLQPAAPSDLNPSISSTRSYGYSRPNSSTGRLRRMIPGSPTGADTPRYLVNQEDLSRYNINGIAEVLLALERIEHDEELTYEQMASLETNLFSSGMLRFYDQHRDMRLDIDDMSYEELLALGDKMGTVSTALSEEALSRSLKKSIYLETDKNGANFLNMDDDIKCSICQAFSESEEEVKVIDICRKSVDGDEVGTMPCQHMYHVSCVQQWLRMKNWCPICKTSAEEEKT